MVTTHSVSQVSFFTQVSDKAVGGTYMTLLNTIGNIGGNWPSTLVLFLVDLFSVKYCYYDELTGNSLILNNQTYNMTALLNKMNKNHCLNDAEKKV